MGGRDREGRSVTGRRVTERALTVILGVLEAAGVLFCVALAAWWAVFLISAILYYVTGDDWLFDWRNPDHDQWREHLRNNPR
jgi:hypothetical protein